MFIFRHPPSDTSPGADLVLVGLAEPRRLQHQLRRLGAGGTGVLGTSPSAALWH